MRRRSNTPLKFLPAIAVSLAVIGMPALAVFEPVHGSEAAAVFPPGWKHADVVLATAQADLSFVRFGAFSNIGIVEIADAGSLRALRRAGALILLPPGALGGCLLPRDPSTPFTAAPSNNGLSI
ncbi:hypothetical protein [Maricaulis sp.]|uniref:hypothetical protein n=1 Tax=Maricaulis sp. TaxID=1486257 RepID=UPI003A94F068